MKQFFCKYWITLLALVLYMASAIIIVCAGETKLELLISCFAIITSLYFGALKHQISNDELFHKLFVSFNERYDDKLNDLLNEIKLHPLKELDDKETNLVIDYFNLCAEEYLWYKKGRLPKDIWKAWKAGIIENMKITQVHSLYQKEMKSPNQRKSYYGLEKELEEELEKSQ